MRGGRRTREARRGWACWCSGRWRSLPEEAHRSAATEGRDRTAGRGASVADDLIEGRVRTEWHGRRRALERGLPDGLGECERTGPAGDVHEAKVGRAEAAVKARAEVAGLPGELVAGALPAGDERLAGVARNLERVDEQDPVAVELAVPVHDLVEPGMRGEGHLPAREGRIRDGPLPRIGRLDPRDVDEPERYVGKQRAVERGAAEALSRREEVARSLPGGDERLVGVARDLEGVDQRHGVRGGRHVVERSFLAERARLPTRPSRPTRGVRRAPHAVSGTR